MLAGSFYNQADDATRVARKTGATWNPSLFEP